MTLDVELVHSGLARVTRTPSLLARILLGSSTTERYAVSVLAITGGFRWVYDDVKAGHDAAVEPDVLAAIQTAERAARRPLVHHAVEPPG